MKKQSADINGRYLAEEFSEMLDTWHSYPEVYDDKLDAEYHRQQAEILEKRQFFDFRSQPYFSPSSANSCPRELYEKVKKAKRDEQKWLPHRSRWVRLGTEIGNWLQRELLFIDKKFAKLTGSEPSFIPERTAEGYPAWEDFVKTMKVVEHNGKKFSIFGKPDGILKHTETGKQVGLEIKSKQTTAAQTSLYSMKEPKYDHVKQCVAYSIMYGVDDFLIVYVNASKKGWNISDEDYAKNPDVRVFHVHVTQSDRKELLDYFASIVEAVENNEPPAVDLSKFTFNNFKTAIAESLTDEEYEELREQVDKVRKSRIPEWKKRSYVDALQYIDEVRSNVSA